MLTLFLLTLLQAPASPRTVGKGPTSGIEVARQVTVRTAAEWATLWRAHAGDGQPPAVDFSREMVAAVFLGTRPTAGYGVEIVRTVSANGGLIVEYAEQKPGQGAIAAQVLTAPYHFVALPRVAGDVRFEQLK